MFVNLFINIFLFDNILLVLKSIDTLLYSIHSNLILTQIIKNILTHKKYSLLLDIRI